MGVKLKAIVPSKQFKAGDMAAAIDKALAKTLQHGQSAFKATTKSWSTQVTFEIDGPSGGEGAVGTNNDIYGYVSRGTRPHLITPHGSWLSWEGGTFRAKTRPGVLGSRSGGNRPTGGVGQAIFARRVQHPGTQARGFEEAVAAKLQPILENEVTAAILKVVG